MKRPPEACRKGMRDARRFHKGHAARVYCRLETREIVRALRAARRTEGVLVARLGIK